MENVVKIDFSSKNSNFQKNLHDRQKLEFQSKIPIFFSKNQIVVKNLNIRQKF